jgi:parallel beta-helix repeat protein
MTSRVLNPLVSQSLTSPTSCWIKKSLVVCLTAAMLTACNGDDGDRGPAGPAGPAGADGAAPSAGNGGVANPDGSNVTTSGYVFPSNAIYVELPEANAAAGEVDITEAIQLAMFEVTDNGLVDATLVLPKGEFVVNDTIVIDSVEGFTLTGYGINETKLDFTNSIGDDAIRFEGGTNITIRDFSVYEAPKNGIKVTNSNGVHLAYTGTIWDGELNDENGAYGLYPLQSTNVLMEHNYARGSADAGIYVGQSSNIVVRSNIAKENVAGIEIENSFNADVYNNLAVGNTGGILVFDLPGLEQAYGGNVRVFNNQAYANNSENFAGGGAVGIVPPGTGALIFATSNVEIYNNEFTDNETAAIEIATYFMADDNVANYVVGDGSGTYEATIAQGWSPLLKNVNIHNNTFARNGGNARGPSIGGQPTLPAFDQIVAGYQGGAANDMSGVPQVFPNILYDGIGELLSNAGALAGWDAIVVQSAKDDGVDHDAFSDADKICVGTNVNGNNISDAADTTNYLAYENVNIGLVYGTDAADATNWSGPGQAAARLLSERMDGPARTLLDCATAPTRLAPAEVTFRGKVYGCNGDDLAEPACSL